MTPAIRYRSDDIATIPNNGDTRHRKNHSSKRRICVWNTILQFNCLYFLLSFLFRRRKEKTTTTKTQRRGGRFIQQSLYRKKDDVYGQTQ
jgi:hypothetical protein